MPNINELLHDAILESEPVIVQQLVDQGADLNISLGPKLPLCVAIETLKEIKIKADMQKLQAAWRIVQILIDAPSIDINAQLKGSFALSEALRAADQATVSLLIEKGADLFIFDNYSSLPFEYIYTTENLGIKQSLISALPYKSLPEIQQAMQKGDILPAAFCFLHLCMDNWYKVDSQSATNTLLDILNWFSEQDDIRLINSLCMNGLLLLQVPLIPKENLTEITAKILRDYLRQLAIIGVMRIIALPVHSECKIYYACQEFLRTEPVINNILAISNTYEMSQNVPDNFHIIMASIKYYLGFLLDDENNYKLITEKWISNMPRDIVCLRIYELIDRSQLGFVRYLFANNHFDFTSLNNGRDIFEMAIIYGMMDVCEFFMELSPNYIPYQVLLDEELSCADEVLPSRRIIFTLFCNIMPLMEANAYVQLAMQRDGLCKIDLILSALKNKIVNSYDEDFSGDHYLDLNIKYPTIHSEQGESRLATSSSIASTSEAKINTVANAIYGGDAIYDQEQQRLYTYQFVRVANEIATWAIRNNCRNSASMLTFINNILMSQATPGGTAMRYEINFGTDVKRSLEIILYFIEYADNAHTERERLKGVIDNLLDQIAVCGMGARQAIQDCLTEIDRGNFNRWLEKTKLDLIKQIIVERLGTAGTNTHIVSWCLQHLHAQGYSVPLGLLENTADELFDIDNIFEVTELFNDFVNALCVSYEQALNLPYILEKVKEELIGLIRTEGCVIREYYNSPSAMATLRTLGLTYIDQADSKEKIYEDVFRIGPVSARVMKAYNELSVYTDFDDPELLSEWTIYIYGPNDKIPNTMLDNNYLFFKLDSEDNVTCILSFVNEEDLDMRQIEITLVDFKYLDDVRAKDKSKILLYMRELFDLDVGVNDHMIHYRVLKALESHQLLRNSAGVVSRSITPKLMIDSSYPCLQIEIMHTIMGIHVYLNHLNADGTIFRTEFIPTRYMTEQELKYLFKCLKDYDFHLIAKLDYDPNEKFLGLSWVNRFIDGRAEQILRSTLSMRPSQLFFSPTPTPSPPLPTPPLTVTSTGTSITPMPLADVDEFEEVNESDDSSQLRSSKRRRRGPSF